ncbi:MAG: hypothetical protein HY290_31470 [Planctomycetia bacterium]|nr:hypothetical protein [Planctomycetia bacterium]
MPDPEKPHSVAAGTPSLPADGTQTKPDSTTSSPETGGMRPVDEFDDYEELTPEIAEEEAIRNDFVIRWAVVLLAFLLASTHIAESASLVHVKTGQYLASHGILPPRTDVFSYTASDRPWANLSWGFDLLVAGIHAIGSFTALSAVKAVVVALIFWLISRISRPGTPTWWGSICGTLALLGCHLRMPLQPMIVTYLGLALTMWLIYSWRESPDKPNRLRMLVPLMLLWCNFDSRAWMGVAFVLLYAAGDALGAWLKSPAALAGPARKQLWQMLGISVAVMVVHPFWWKSLAAPWFLYSAEYPALRDYILETVIDPTRTNPGNALTFFPMTIEELWAWPHMNLGILSSLAVIGLAIVSFLLNRARLDWGHLAAFLGFALLAVACLNELPAAALVAAVVATLNGQSWYAAACRQTYSIETGELLFSRGGRALTVLALAALGFFGGTGRLRDASAARPGYGLDQTLEMQVNDLEKLLAGDASFDHRPFNSLLSQGDQLIWVGEKVFCDQRVGLYYGPDDESNLLRRHILTRDALRGPRSAAAKQRSASVRGDAWQKTFDQYGISHTVVRLLVERDYDLLAELLQQPRDWEWTKLGASSAVFYRTSLKGDEAEKYQAYLDANRIDFRKEAYEDQVPDVTHPALAVRSRTVRAPSFYKKYFWSTKVESSPEISEGLQLAKLVAFRLPPRLDFSRTAMAYLAIRRAQEGLAKDPDDVKGYLVLGQAYDFLSQIEYQASLGTRPPRSGMRYLQAVAAYNQALIGEPDNLLAHRQLLQIYSEAKKLDLGFRHLQALDDDMLTHPDHYSPDETKAVGQQIKEVAGAIKQIEKGLPDAGAGTGDSKNSMQRLQTFLQQQCLLRALAELERDGKQSNPNPQIEQLRIGLLLEAGRVEEAYDAALRFSAMADMNGVSTWADIVAVACLPQADYDAAKRHWEAAGNELDRIALARLLMSAPPRTGDPASPWPLTTTTSALTYFYQNPEEVASTKLSVALALLEQGRVRAAEQAFRDVLAISPNSNFRPFVRFYLSELTFGKEVIDLVPPANRVVEEFTPEESE